MYKFSMQRRWLLVAGIGLAAGNLGITRVFADLTQSAARPDPKTFETGDLVWPKRPGAFVPYAGTPVNKLLVDAEELREDEWNDLRIQYIRSARSDAPVINPDIRAYRMRVADVVENLSYTRFFNDYSASVGPDDFQTFGAGQIAYVGHVGIIEVDPSDRTPYVIEAVYGNALACKSCVERVLYDEWLKARGNVLVWHGRLTGLDVATRGGIAMIAKQQLDRPYQFFNFDLMDDTGFYCSKLVWFSVFRASGIALDNDSNPRRLKWFSPLQAMNSKKHIVLLSSPGNYRNI